MTTKVRNEEVREKRERKEKSLSRDRPQDQDKVLWIEQAFHPHHGWI